MESLQGFIWNDTLSCAYDSVWVILLAIYKTDRQRWNSDIRDQNRCLSLFTEYMEQVNDQSIEDVSTVMANWRDIMSMIHFLASLCSMCMKARPSWNSLLRFKTNNIDYAE